MCSGSRSSCPHPGPVHLLPVRTPGANPTLFAQPVRPLLCPNGICRLAWGCRRLHAPQVLTCPPPHPLQIQPASNANMDPAPAQVSGSIVCPALEAGTPAGQRSEGAPRLLPRAQGLLECRWHVVSKVAKGPRTPPSCRKWAAQTAGSALWSPVKHPPPTLSASWQGGRLLLRVWAQP